MGRWAQRKRGGGGETALNVIRVAQIIPTQTIRLTYWKPVDASQFAAGAFDTLPDNITCAAVSQIGTYQVDLQMDDNVTDQDEVRYVGDTPGILSPQQKPLSA